MASSDPPKLTIDLERFRVRPGETVSLAERSSRTKAGYEGSKSDGKHRLLELNDRLADLQQMLYAEARHKVLLVLQGMDSSGKDGTIKHVFHGVNPLGVRVANFKKPNDVELAHDYLWRVHEHTPRNGTMTIFNRSHYEDVLVVRVHDLAPERVWRKRYSHIRDFERMLADEGTLIIKVFLHISRDEQRDRLQARLDDPAKNWKFEHGDLTERAHWAAYTEAYEDALSETSTEWAPWYVVPSDRKWYRNLVVSNLLIEGLAGLHMRYPKAPPGLADVHFD